MTLVPDSKIDRKFTLANTFKHNTHVIRSAASNHVRCSDRGPFVSGRLENPSQIELKYDFYVGEVACFGSPTPRASGWNV